MRFVSPLLLLLLLLFAYCIWFGENGLPENKKLNNSITTQTNINANLQNRNTLLKHEIDDLKQAKNAIEERARNELGLIKEGEIFFRLSGELTE